MTDSSGKVVILERGEQDLEGGASISCVSSTSKKKAMGIGAAVGTVLASPVAAGAGATGITLISTLSGPVSSSLVVGAGFGLGAICVLPLGAGIGAGIGYYFWLKNNPSAQPTSSCDNSTRGEKNETLSSDDQSNSGREDADLSSDDQSNSGREDADLSSDDQSQSGREDENPPSYESIAVYR